MAALFLIVTLSFISDSLQIFYKLKKKSKFLVKKFTKK